MSNHAARLNDTILADRHVGRHSDICTQPTVVIDKYRLRHLNGRSLSAIVRTGGSCQCYSWTKEYVPCCDIEGVVQPKRRLLETTTGAQNWCIKARRPSSSYGRVFNFWHSVLISSRAFVNSLLTGIRY